SIGDIVKFKIGSIETDKGEVKFIEEDCNESTLYINNYSGWAYKVPEKKIVSPITVEKDSGKECNNSFSLGSREERVALLKAGFTGKDIESEYLRRNRIVIIGINWQDLKSK
ncbi:MAG: hypothetical protein Q7J35_08810, partial [Candidatus Methanoperedens sp.]|nr:hypothetical protein [Candidatus Methanoperedens sp.]